MEETTELVPIQFEKVMQSRAYTCIVLGAETKKFAIYTEPLHGKSMQAYLTETPHPRPLTHDLLLLIFKGFDIRLKHIVIYEQHDTIFHARLFLEQQIESHVHILEIDARPSDCISLALVQKAPIYCTRPVLERAIPYTE